MGRPHSSTSLWTQRKARGRAPSADPDLGLGGMELDMETNSSNNSLQKNPYGGRLCCLARAIFLDRYWTPF